MPKNSLEELNPERRHADELFKDRPSSRSRLTDSLEEAENNPRKVREGTVPSLHKEERQPRFTYESNEDNNVSSKKKGAKSKGRGGLKKKLATRLFLGIVSVVVSIAAFFMFLPLKMMSLMENLKEQAAGLVERPLEKRFQHLVNTFIAGKIVAGSDGNRFDKYVCPSGGYFCSAFRTWQINKFEEKIGLKIESNRTGSGGATKWKITARDGTTIDGEGPDGEIVQQLEREINGSREMRRFIKDEVRKATKWHQVYKRYAMRKMLMRKYDVKGWRGPEKLEKAFDTYTEKKAAYKIALKKRIVKATVGRVSPRIGSYLECLIESGDPNCSSLQTDEADPPSEDQSDPNQSEQDRRAEADARTGQDQIANNGELDDSFIDNALRQEGEGTARELSKLFSKEVTKKILAGSVAGVGIISTLALIVEKFDGGAPNAVIEKKNELAYVGFATEVLTASDKLRAGDLDPENIQAWGEILGTLEKSPYAQHEMGIDDKIGTTEKPVVRDCDDDGKLDAPLAAGQFLCPNKKVTTNVTELVRNFPGWNTVLVPIATAWNNSAGAVVDAISAVVGGALDAIGFNDAIAWVADITGLGELAGDAMNTLFDATLGSPVTGLEENGDAYDAISIGSKVAFNGMMKNGVDSEGKGMGMGGAALSDAQFAQLNASVEADRVADFNNKPLFARLFDPYLMGSMANTLAIRTPSNLSAFISNPFAQLKSFFNPTTASAFQPNKGNPTGIAYYSYTDNDPALTADPGAYTEESCKASAEAREASYSMEDGETSPRYHKTDPCALEKVVRISATAVFTDENDAEFNLYQTQQQPSTGGIPGTPGETVQKGQGWGLKENTDYSGTTCAAGSTETQIYKHPTKGFTIRLCKIDGTGVIVASIVSAQVARMFTDAGAAGVDLKGKGITGAFRSYEQQIETRKRNGCPADPTAPSSSCRTQTAPPGESEHERGLAIDFSTGTSTIPKGSSQFNWLAANAKNYGYYNLPKEPWHWSPSGY